VWSKYSNGLKWRGLGSCAGSPFEWTSPTQKWRLQSCFHEVIDYRGIEDALCAPARLCRRNNESRTAVAKRISGGGQPDPERSDQGSVTAFGREKRRHWPRSLIAWLEWSWRTWRQSLPPTVPYRRAGACMATCDPVPWRSFFDGLAAECDMAPAQISRDAYLLLGTSGARAKPLLGHWLEMQ